jgi:ABC-type transport system substrate-binding protein
MRYVALPSLLLVIVASVWAADPAAGTWKLNPAKSKYSPGPPTKSATVTYEETADGIRRTGESITADGTKNSFEYSAKYDGKDYPVKGSALFNAISIKRVNDHTTESTLKKDGKPVMTARRVISKDGKTLTITTTGTNAKGEKVRNVNVYDKQ